MSAQFIEKIAYTPMVLFGVKGVVYGKIGGFGSTGEFVKRCCFKCA